MCLCAWKMTCKMTLRTKFCFFLLHEYLLDFHHIVYSHIYKVDLMRSSSTVCSRVLSLHDNQANGPLWLFLSISLRFLLNKISDWNMKFLIEICYSGNSDERSIRRDYQHSYYIWSLMLVLWFCILKSVY